MSKNIKEIGKELLGKSLNSFHRKTGLIQLEKNNEMQDGILNGILSQVDDAYIEKTEQSNVIYLEGSGDGVVVLDSIEGNTMVNIMPLANWGNKSSDNGNCAYSQVILNTLPFKPNTTYTTILLNAEGIVTSHWMHLLSTQGPTQGTIATFTTISDVSMATSYLHIYFGGPDNTVTQEQINNIKVIVLEGDWTDKEIPQYFEGMKSSFEEKVNGEGKYEIEILSNNKNLFDGKLSSKPQHGGATVEHIDTNNFRVKATNTRYASVCYELKVKPNETYKLKVKGTKIKAQGGVYVRIYDKDDSYKSEEVTNVSLIENSFEKELKFTTKELSSNKFYGVQFYCVGQTTNTDGEWLYENVQLEKSTNSTNYVPHKQNKIKLLLDEPLRSLPNGVKDRLCIKGGKLVVEKNVVQVIIDDKIEWNNSSWNNDDSKKHFFITASRENFRKHLKYDIVDCLKSTDSAISDKMLCRSVTLWTCDERMFAINGNVTYDLQIGLLKSELSQLNTQGVKTYFTNNPIKICIQCKEPIYEEVLNEYGEPIILEGYENGTLYIDSTIIPTTTVRYTPKMETLNALKEVYNNNVMLTSDVNDNIIPYMMDVDLMIMEKELCLLNTKNNRKMEVLDMTSMQKRTQEMLERLIKGKTLTEQECKTRVTTYLNAGKITDEQAEELMLVISEIYN